MNANDIHQLCLNIINIPKIMTKEGNVSFYSLLRESGYSEMPDRVTMEVIREALLEHPDCINDWIQYSEDQRCHPTWFFQRNGADYEVGFVSLDTDDVPVTRYSDPFEACATFIKQMIERFRLNDNK